MSRFCICGLIVPVLIMGIFSLGLAQDAKRPAQKKEHDLDAVVAGNNQFAFDLYHQLSQKPGNKFFSPYSISTALGMTYAGARGNTAKEMAQTLHFTLDNRRLHPAFGELIWKVNGADRKRKYELSVANSLWGNKSDLSLDPMFLRILRSNYQSDFQLVDFTGDGEGARLAINGWVKEKTRNKVADFIPKGLIERKTRLVVANAIYFRGEWLVPFPRAATKPDDFFIPGSSVVKTPMMNCTLTTRYMENAAFQMAEFAYKDKDVSMLVILPKKRNGLRDVEAELSSKALARALAQLQAAELQASLPKFKMVQEFYLSAELKRLGMKDAFVPKIADFYGMEDNHNPDGSLYISEVVHKAFFDVSEEGAEAAAASGVVMSRPGSTEQADPITFRVDHPFLFVIRHNATGSILFMGRLFAPASN